MKTGLPEGFQTRMRQILGNEYEAFALSLNEGRVQGLRFNSLKAPLAEELASCAGKFTLSPVPWCEEGFYYGDKDRPGRHAFHEAGLYYIQEPSAMAPVEELGVKPGEKILDLCAAPGGKSTQIAAKMKGEGLLIANEISPARARVLSQNIERLGVVNAVVVNEEPDLLAERFPDFFDRILVDAPCSCEALFCREEAARAEWSEENVTLCAARDSLILDAASRMLKPGGSLLYSTCTFEPGEDEGAVDAFLKTHPDFSLLPGFPKQLWPHRKRCEGHFMALLKKSEDKNLKALPARSRKKENPRFLRDRGALHVIEEGLGEIFKERTLLPDFPAGRLLLFGEEVYAVPEGCPDLEKLHVLRPGLHIGTLKKNRFEPAHALALCVSPQNCRLVLSLPADGEKIARYLRGEPIPAGDGKKGWVLVCADEYSLGWGKAVNGVLKNHYPKGLRRV